MKKSSVIHLLSFFTAIFPLLVMGNTESIVWEDPVTRIQFRDSGRRESWNKDLTQICNEYGENWRVPFNEDLWDGELLKGTSKFFRSPLGQNLPSQPAAPSWTNILQDGWRGFWTQNFFSNKFASVLEDIGESYVYFYGAIDNDSMGSRRVGALVVRRYFKLPVICIKKP